MKKKKKKDHFIYFYNPIWQHCNCFRGGVCETENEKKEKKKYSGRKDREKKEKRPEVHRRFLVYSTLLYLPCHSSRFSNSIAKRKNITLVVKE